MESIVYAVDWNQVRENVFAGAAWLGGSGGAEVIEQLRKPTALVCSSKGAEKTAMAGGRTKRDNLLLGMVRNTIEKGGTVIIPTDSSARVLELAWVLEHAWRKEAAEADKDSPFRTAKLFLASRTVGATMRYARSMLEWMDEAVVREFESESMTIGDKHRRRGNSRQGPTPNVVQSGGSSLGGPFEFKHLKLIESRKRLERMLGKQGPRVILASDSSLRWGFSKEILERVAARVDNLVILTENLGPAEGNSQTPSSLKETLWQMLRDGKTNVTAEVDGLSLEKVFANGRKLTFNDPRRVPLESQELAIYEQYLAVQRRSENFSQMGRGTILEASADAVDEASSSSSSSDDDSDPERQGKALNTTAKAARFNRSKVEPSKEALGVNVLLRYKGMYDYDVRDKKGRDQIFPFVNKRRRADDFGELIKPEDFLRAEERDEMEGEDLRDKGDFKRESLGQKRKWQDTGLPKENGANKKRQRKRPTTNGVLKHASGLLETNNLTEEEESSADSEPDSDAAVAGPAKLEMKTNTVEAQLQIAHVDFAGLHDQRSLSMLLPKIQPKKLILVGGTSAETTYLAQDCRQKLGLDSTRETQATFEFVMTPAVGQKVDASVDTNAWTVKLSEALTRQLHWQSVRGLGVVTLAGHLTAGLLESFEKEDENSRKRLKTGKDGVDPTALADDELSRRKKLGANPVPTLDLLPSNVAAATRSLAQPIHVGDLRLADLRKLLQAAGHTADFRGEGTLLIDGLVAVRKSATGRIEVESGGFNLPDVRSRSLEGPFYAVRKKIYDGLAVIAGG